MLFGTTELFSRRPDTLEEIELSKKMRKAWTTFAKDPVQGLAKQLGWPLYEDNKSTIVRLGGPNSSEIAFEPQQKHDLGCPKTVL
jgi:carboxylesterase type B